MKCRTCKSDVAASHCERCGTEAAPSKGVKYESVFDGQRLKLRRVP